METDSLAERILNDINAVFRRDPNIDEFDIIPVLDAQNKSPVIHEGHKFALEAWCVKHMFHYCYYQLMDWKEQKKKADPSTVLQWSVVILLVNPDVQMVWNLRKDMIVSGHLLSKDEMSFSAIVMSRKPKCADIFSQRKWLLLNLFESNRCPSHERKNELVQAELDICKRAASKYPNNYHAWSHRIWIVQKLVNVTREVLHKELESNEEWVTCHVSEHSGLQYRQFLLDTLAKLDKETKENEETTDGIHSASDNHVTSTEKNGKETNANHWLPSAAGDGDDGRVARIGKFLRKEMEMVSGLQLTFEGHEALWYHRRYVLHAMNREGLLKCNSPVALAIGNFKVACNLGPTYKKTKLETVPNHVHSLDAEVDFLERCVLRSKNDLVQLGLLAKHRKWLELITGVTVHSISNNFSKNHHQF